MQRAVEATRLAADVDSVSEESICIGVVQVLRRAEAEDSAVAVRVVVVGALNLGQVRGLVQRRRGLVLAVAGAGDRR